MSYLLPETRSLNDTLNSRDRPTHHTGIHPSRSMSKPFRVEGTTNDLSLVIQFQQKDIVHLQASSSNEFNSWLAAFQAESGKVITSARLIGERLPTTQAFLMFSIIRPLSFLPFLRLSPQLLPEMAPMKRLVKNTAHNGKKPNRRGSAEDSEFEFSGYSILPTNSTCKLSRQDGIEPGHFYRHLQL